MVVRIQLIQIALIISAAAKTKSEVVENVKFHSGLLFPEITTIGYYVAFVIPVDLPKQTIFMSAGFEQYYTLPYKPYHWFPPVDNGRSNSEDMNSKTRRSNKHTNTNSIYENLFTRTRAYELIETNLDMLGADGNACLLRTICEVNANPLDEHNGVYGSILQILFTPSSSEYEGLENEYYEAENDGRKNKCDLYNDDCPVSLLDMFSKEFDID